MSSNRVFSQIPLSIILLGSLLLAVPFHIRPENFIVDDGYFYPQIARFIAHGQGSTFNGIMPTNGYHPLWMGVCVLASYITSSSDALVQILGAIQDLLLIASIALIVSIARLGNFRGAIFGCMPLLFFGMVLGIWRLLETNLALFLQMCVLILVVPVFPWVQKRLAGWRNPLIGAFLGLVMLARLDLLFFVVTVLVYEFTRKADAKGASSRITRCAIQISVAIALLAPYLAWNWTHFHHLLPISGAIKSSFPRVQAWHLALFVYPVAAAILLNVTLLFKRVRSCFDTLCLLTAGAAALHMTYTLSFGELAPWYLTTGYLSVSLCIIWIADLLIRRVRRFSWMEPALASFVFIAFLLLGAARLYSNFTYTHLRTGRVFFSANYLESKRALAEKLDQTLPSGSRIIVYDAPGGVAFYSHMSILPLDGLVSDYAYNQEVVSETLVGYASKKHIEYFLAPYLHKEQALKWLRLGGVGIADGQVMTVESPLTHQSAGSFTLTDADLVLRFRQVNPDLEPIYPEIGVWRLPRARDAR